MYYQVFKDCTFNADWFRRTYLIVIILLLLLLYLTSQHFLWTVEDNVSGLREGVV
jgi:hypothetical protein